MRRSATMRYTIYTTPVVGTIENVQIRITDRKMVMFRVRYGTGRFGLYSLDRTKLDKYELDFFELVMKVCILWVTTYHYLIMKLGDAIEHKLAADAQ